MNMKLNAGYGKLESALKTLHCTSLCSEILKGNIKGLNNELLIRL